MYTLATLLPSRLCPHPSHIEAANRPRLFSQRTSRPRRHQSCGVGEPAQDLAQMHEAAVVAVAKVLLPRKRYGFLQLMSCGRADC